MTTNKGPIARLTEIAAALPGVIAKMDAAKNDLAQRMASLEQLGLIYATVHMKDGKYATLLYPIQPGQPRRRKYVGRDPQKIMDAKDAIQRAKDYDELAKQGERLDMVLAQGYRSLQEATRELTSWRP
jgi:hypothetical protein